MSYETVRKIINKAINIEREVNSFSSEELEKALLINTANSKEELISKLIRSSLSNDDYDTYVKYCQFYKAQKELELRESITLINNGLDNINKLYDERYDLLREKQIINQDKDSVIRAIKGLAWIALDIEYKKIKKVHDSYVTSFVSGNRELSKIDDEIDGLKNNRLFRRKKNKEKLAFLKEEKNATHVLYDSLISALKADLDKNIKSYHDTLVRVLSDGLKVRCIYDSAVDSIKINTDKSQGKEFDISMIVDEFISYAEQLYSTMEEEYYISDIEEGLYPPILKLCVISPELYLEYFIKFVTASKDISLGRCDVQVSNIMKRIRELLNEQKEIVSKLYGPSEGIVINSNSPSDSERSIFQLVYNNTNK